MKFYIFGIPHGFDIFQGTAEETRYFQSSFYDGSKEKAKLTIHRMEDGQVSYSYLCYKIIAKDGRAGAFFGMSVVFDREYCYDVTKLYRLFDFVYKERILKKGILLKEIKNNSEARAQFEISKFKDAANEISIIENDILTNLKNTFAKNDFKTFDPSDPSFKKGNVNLIMEMNNEEGNNAILEDLKKYSYVSISPAFKKRGVRITEKRINELYGQSSEISKKIANYSLDLNENNIALIKSKFEELKTEIQNAKSEIQPFSTQDRIPKLQEDYNANEGLLNKLKDKVESLTIKYSELHEPIISPSPPKTTITFNGKEWEGEDLLLYLQEKLDNDKNEVIAGCLVINTSSEATEEQKEQARKLNKQAENSSKTGWLKKISKMIFGNKEEKNKRIDKTFLKFVAIFFCVICIGVSLFVFYPENSNGGDSQNMPIEKPAENTAVVVPESKKTEQYFIDSLKQCAAIEYEKGTDANNKEVYKKKYDKEIDRFNAVKTILEQTRQYNYNPEKDIKNYGQETIRYYEGEMKAAKQQNNREKYADYILEIDPSDKDALEIKKGVSGSTEQKKVENCKITYKMGGQSYTKEITELLQQFDKDLKKKKGYFLVIDVCDIINSTSCATDAQKGEATKLKTRAVNIRDSKESLIPAF